MAAATTIALVGAGIAAAGTVGSYFEQKKAARRAERKQEKANDISRASAQVENARQRRRAIAQARIAQAQNIANQSQQVQSSSALTGVQSGITSQLGANIGAQQQMIGNQLAIQGAQQSAADALRRGQERAGMWSAVGNIGQTAMGFGAQASNFGAGTSGGYLNSATAGSQRTGYTNNQFSTWLNNQ